MALLVKIRRTSSSAVLTLPAQWIEWIEREGYSGHDVDLEIHQDGIILIRPVRAPTPTQTVVTA